MIKNSRLWRQQEKRIIRQEKISFSRAIKIFAGMWAEGKSLGVLPPKNCLEGIETDIRIARILNRCLKK